MSGDWSISGQTIAIFAAMAVVTYLIRASGVLLVRRFKPSAALEAWIGYVPGCVMISLAVPAAAASGPIEWAGMAVAVVLALMRVNLSITLLGATALVAALRLIA